MLGEGKTLAGFQNGLPESNRKTEAELHSDFGESRYPPGGKEVLT
jgi:hypothetical protein